MVYVLLAREDDFFIDYWVVKNFFSYHNFPFFAFFLDFFLGASEFVMKYPIRKNKTNKVNKVLILKSIDLIELN